MKRLLLTLLLVPALALAQKTPQGVTYDAKIVRVNDGDTVVIAAPFLPAPLKPELAVRIYGVDTPEMPDAWTEGEVEALIEMLQDQLHEMVSKRNIQALERSNLWSGAD